MIVDIEQTKWWQRIWAALIFFTRLPFWRIYQPPQVCYKTVVEHWPLVGWLTGGMMALVIYFGSWVMPYSVAVMAAIICRILTTGALHEDGLADFFDGFGGGGNDRDRILAIMKDSHIGTYGVLALILYLALLFVTLLNMAPEDAALAVFAGDAYSKLLAGQIVQFLPYARTEDTAKNRTVYRRIGVAAGISMFVQGVLPLAPLLYIGITRATMRWELVVFVPCIVMYFLYFLMLRRLKGYTGDCCGALFLLVELSFYITVLTQL